MIECEGFLSAVSNCKFPVGLNGLVSAILYLFSELKTPYGISRLFRANDTD